jgi:spore germination cell wall hydrolase CwlJ-like protein
MKAKPDRAEVVKFVDQLIESDLLETKSESPKLAKFNQNHRPAHAPDSRGGQFAPKGEGSDGSAADGSQSPQLQLPVDAPTTAENVRVTAGETDSASYGTDSFGNTMSPEVQSQINQAMQHMDLDTAPASENDHRSSGQAARSSAIGPHGYIPAQGDANLLARALFAEGGKTPRDMAAIAWSIINRIGAPTFRDSLTGVLHQSNQFAFLPEGGGPPKGSKEWQHSENPETLTGAAAAAWQNAQSIVNGVFAGSTPDPTGGATGYFSWPSYNGTPGTAPPSWRYPLRDNRYSPSPYTSSDGNYFFVQNPANVWHSNRHRGRH